MTTSRSRALLLVGEPTSRRRLHAALEGAGLTVMDTLTAERALDVLPSLSPALVLADLDLQGGGGLAFLESAHRRLGQRAPRLVAVSEAPPDPNTATRLRAATCHTWFRRDADPHEAILAIRGALGGPPADARASRRLATVVAARVRRASGDTFGLTADVSAGGAFIRCSAPPPIGERLLLCLNVDAEGPPVSLAAQVRHHRSGSGGGFGAEFLDAWGAPLAALGRFLAAQPAC